MDNQITTQYTLRDREAFIKRALKRADEIRIEQKYSSKVHLNIGDRAHMEMQDDETLLDYASRNGFLTSLIEEGVVEDGTGDLESHMEDWDEDTRERARALARFLDCRVTDLTLEQEDPHTFSQYSRKVREGMSPTEARQRIALVRGALRIIRGEAADGYTTGFFLEQLLEHDAVKERITRLESEIATEVLSHENRERVLERGAQGGLYLNPTAEEFNALRKHVGEGKAAAYYRLTHESALLESEDNRRWIIQQRIRALPHVADKIRRLEEMAARLPDFATYRNLTREMRANPETAALFKIGTHELINTLYFLSPEHTEYERRDKYGNGELKWHTRVLQAAFNGQEIEDTRPVRRTDAGEYMVVTEDEADALHEQDLESYVEEFVRHEVPESLRKYFDEKAWKEDARSEDGARARSLAGYDHEENTGTDPESGEEFYIYRTN